MDACRLIRAEGPTTPRAARNALEAGAAARLRAAVEALILSLLAALLSRRARAWRHAAAFLPATPCEASPLPSTPTNRHRTIHDGTHLVCEHPILWVIGPGTNRGLRPRVRAMPVPRPRIARAPPA